MNSVYMLDALNRPELLIAMMKTLASDESRIAFEGNLSGTELFGMEGASYDEAGILQRATIAPRLDYVVLGLTQTRVPAIEKAIKSKIAFGGYQGIIHVQIEVKGQIAFAAYDNFNRDSVVVNAMVPTSLLNELVDARVLRGFSLVAKS